MSLDFLVSSDTQLLDQYYTLRERCFRRELDLPEFDGSEEELDRQSAVLLAVQDGQCVGGVRISPHITLPSQVDSLELDRDSCCMWERFVVDPAARNVPFIREFIAQLVVESSARGYRHAMVLSSRCNARFYRRCLSSLDVGFEIQRHVPHCALGAFAGLEHYLSVAYLDESQQQRIAV